MQQRSDIARCLQQQLATGRVDVQALYAQGATHDSAPPWPAGVVSSRATAAAVSVARAAARVVQREKEAAFAIASSVHYAEDFVLRCKEAAVNAQLASMMSDGSHFLMERASVLLADRDEVTARMCVILPDGMRQGFELSDAARRAQQRARGRVAGC